MRFMFIVKSAHTGPPPPEFLEASNKLANREIQAGRLIDMGNLCSADLATQVRLSGGQVSVLDGPFVEAKEVVGGYAIFELPGQEEAVASAREFIQLTNEFFPDWEGTCEVRALAPAHH